MARREWALKKALKVWASFRGGLGDYGAQLAYGEHARAVRIVSQYMKRYGTEGSPCELICNDLITALTKGRGKGRK